MGNDAGAVHVVWHPLCLEHDAGPGHPESPDRLRAVVEHLRGCPAAASLTWSEAEAAPGDLLHRVHPAEYLDRIERLCRGGGGRIDGDTVVNTMSFEAATRGAGAAVEMVQRVLDGQPTFAAVRPPGHHATRDRAMGFCLINNVVVAAQWALEVGRVDRVLIVDWDVHHGNGTQDLVEREPSIRYVSMHQWPLYPGTGRADERGVGNIFNVPRPPGLPRSTYVDDLDQAVHQAVDGWTPDVILVSAGYDAMAGDPLAGFTLEPEDYGSWVERWREIAPIGAVLEGGYAPQRIKVAAEVTVNAMA